MIKRQTLKFNLSLFTLVDTHQMVLRDVCEEEALHHFLKQQTIRVNNSSGVKAPIPRL